MRKAIAPLLMLIATTALAQSDDLINADRPGIADGSATVRKGAFQLETGFERDRSGPERAWLTPTLLRYGLSDTFELRVEGDGYEHDGHDGWAPVSIGAKYHFLEHPQLGLIGRLFAINTSETSGDLRAVADFDLNDRWSLNPNIGFAREDGSSTATAAATLQYNISKKANVFVDAAAERSSVVLDTGAAWILGRDTQVDVSVGWGVHGVQAPDVFWSAGISRRF